MDGREVCVWFIVMFLLGFTFGFFITLGAGEDLSGSESSTEVPIVCTSYGYIIPSMNKTVIGERTYMRWDGVCRPVSELNFSSGNWTYLVTELTDRYVLSRRGGNIALPKKAFLNWGFGFDRVTLSIQANSIQQLIDRSDYFNSTCRFIKIGEAQQWRKIKNTLWSGDFGWEQHLSIYDSNGSEFNNTKASFHIVHDNVYFLECDNQWFQNAIYPITINFNSYIINGTGGDSSWGSGSYTNTVVKKSTNEVQLDWAINDWHGYWSFDDNSGAVLIDETGLHNGTIYNMEEADWITGKHGKALRFGGTNEYVDCLNPSHYFDIYPMSFEVWFNTTQVATYPGIIGTYKYGTYKGFGNILVTGSASGLYYRDNSNKVSTSTGGDLRDGVWHHLFTIVNSSGAFIWLDGDYIGTTGWTGSAGAVSTTNPFIIGKMNGFTYYIGDIDEVKVWNRTLTPTEINQSMANEHELTGNYTTILLDAGGGNSVKNATVTFISNGQTVDLWGNCSGSWVEYNTSITSGVNYDITGSQQKCSLMLEFSTSNVSKTPEVSKIEVWYGSTGGPSPPSICGDLSSANSVYTMSGNLSSTGTCFNVTADNVTLDCAGYSITYGTSAVGNAVVNLGHDNITLRECVLIQGGTNISSYAVHFNDSGGGLIFNNTISTLTEDSGGVKCEYCTDVNISLNTVSAVGEDAYGLIALYSGEMVISSNIINTNDTGIFMCWTNSSTVSYNVVTTVSSTAGWGVQLNAYDYNNLVEFNNINTVYRAFRIDLSNNNTVHDNRVTSTGNYALCLEQCAYDSPNLVYNNLFNGSAVPYAIFGIVGENYLNTSSQVGTRIYSPGTNIGGNYWTNSSGNGYSDVCTDADTNGFCDLEYNLTANNTDYFPLSDEYAVGGNCSFTASTTLSSDVSCVTFNVSNNAVVRLSSMNLEVSDKILIWGGGMIVKDQDSNITVQ